MKKSYKHKNKHPQLRDDFFRRLGFNGVTMKRMFDLVSEFNFNMVDEEGRIMAFNRRNCENCNIKDEAEIIGRSRPDCFPKVLSDIYMTRNRQVRESGKPIINQTYTHGADRSTDIKVVSIFPLYDTSGKIIGTTCLNRSLESGMNKPDWYGLIKAAVAYIDDHCAERLPISRLAAISNMSVTTFRREFLKIMEMTPGAYITTIRINKARKLLTETNKTMDVIAVECGFYDQSHFVKIFKQLRRQTPTQYRQAHFDSRNPKIKP